MLYLTTISISTHARATYLAGLLRIALLALLIAIVRGALASPASPHGMPADAASYRHQYPSLSTDQVVQQATDGNPQAQHQMAMRLANGRDGLPVNQSEALRWLSIAAQRGYAQSSGIDRLPAVAIRARRNGNNSAAATNTQPVAHFSATQPDTNAATLHADASGSTDSDGDSIIRYTWWASGDAISVTNLGQSAVFTFAEPGNYRVSLAVVDAHGATHSTSRELVVLGPAAEQPADLQPANDEFIFDTTPLLSWSADTLADSYDLRVFDDTGTLLESVDGLAVAAHCALLRCQYQTTTTLSAPATFTWQLRAVNTTGASDWQSASFRRALPNPPPVAALSLSGYHNDALGLAPFTVSASPFASTDDDAIIEYQWHPGDGSAMITSTDPGAFNHTYQTPGSYVLTLTVTDTTGQQSSITRSIDAVAPVATPPERIAVARLLAQASFGPTRAAIDYVQVLGIENAIEQQLRLLGEPHLDYVTQYSNGSEREARHDIWWLDAVYGVDQLRQRVAFALSQIFVISDTGYTLSNSQYGVTHYYDQLRELAFGNYRDLLETVTLSPMMGRYLSMLQNARGDEAGITRPDENFAREVLQLFSIGLTVLELDGSPRYAPDSEGRPRPVPVYTQNNVEEFARVFTGWNYAGASRWDVPLFTGEDIINPMEPFEDYHDTGAKQLLTYPDDLPSIARDIPAGGSARDDLDMALDNIFYHPNVGPFISTQLIQRLVTSNPSPAYIARVATVFNDDGSGVRGNLGAVVRAILLDSEAREPDVTDPGYGKLREPVLRLSHLWRAFSVTPGEQSQHGELNVYSPQLTRLELATGQAPLRSPSVFNFYSPGHSPSGILENAGLVAPEFEILTDNNLIATLNRIGAQVLNHYAGNPGASYLNPSYLNYAYEESLYGNSAMLLQHLDEVLTAGSLSVELRDILLPHLDDHYDQNSWNRRFRDVIAVLLAAPDYLIQR